MNRKQLREAFPEVPNGNLDLCHRLMYGQVDDGELPEATQRWLKRCYHRPSQPELALEAINELLGGLGTEGIYSTRWIDSYHCDVLGAYVNMGDIYATTILRDHQTGKWWLTSLGNYAAFRKGIK